MGRVNRGALLNALFAFVVGSGFFYWLYRWFFRSEPSGYLPVVEEQAREESSLGDQPQSPEPADGLLSRMPATVVISDGLRTRVSGIAVIPSVPQPHADALVNPSSSLVTQDIIKLIKLLNATDDSSVQEQVLKTLSNSAAYSVNQDRIRNLGGIPSIGNMLSDPVPEVKVQALNTLNNLSMNLQNQELIKVYIAQICTCVEVSPLNSDVQLAALRVLTNLSVTNKYQDMMVDCIHCFLHLLSYGNESTQKHVLKVLVNLSANPSLTIPLLSAHAPPALPSFYETCTNVDILVRALTFVANLKQHMHNRGSSEGHRRYHEDSLYALFFGESRPSLHKFVTLLWHHDMEVRRQIARIVLS